MSAELTTAISTVIAFVVGWLVKQFLNKKTPDATPSPVPTPSPSPAPSPVPEPDDGSDDDPFNKLPGLPGHPVMNLIWGLLQRMLDKKKFGDDLDADPVDDVADDAAMAALANVLKADPGRLSKMKGLLDK